jgi:hypothetical protein
LEADGTLDTSFDPGAGADGPVEALALLSDGKILVAGSFRGFADADHSGVVRLNDDGSVDRSFHAGLEDGSVMAMAVQSDGNVLIGGSFHTVHGVFRPYLARLRDDGGVIPPLRIARSGEVAIVSWPAGDGDFFLQASTDLGRVDSWSPVTEPVEGDGTGFSVSMPIDAPWNFFRLVSP